MLFRDRVRLANEFERWQEEHDAKPCALGLITYLDMNGYINENKVKADLKEREGKQDDSN